MLMRLSFQNWGSARIDGSIDLNRFLTEDHNLPLKCITVSKLLSTIICLQLIFMANWSMTKVNFSTFKQNASTPAGLAKLLTFQSNTYFSCEPTGRCNVDPSCRVYPLVTINKDYLNFILGDLMMPPAPPPPYWWLSQWYLWRWYQWQRYYSAVHYGKSYTYYTVVVLL